MMHSREGPESLLEESRAKRQRSSVSDDGETSFAPRDCFQALVDGHVNDGVYHSWLLQSRTQSLASIHSSDETIRSAIQSLHQQLTQVKRRLWPAAERCAQVSGSQAPGREFSDARSLCNPMEALGERKGHGLNKMFLNRSAIKLANLDALLEFRLTQSTDPNFIFVDLCGAPGGFSEYLMKRAQSTRSVGSCRGYGMSLIGTNEHGQGTIWGLDSLSQVHGTFVTTYKISGGHDGTGDIYQWENVLELTRGMQHDLQASGVKHTKANLVVSDGGFDAQRNSECQEELAQKLILCEMAAGIHLLSEGGNMIIKMFGFQTQAIRHAMQSLYDMFQDIVVFKPISSRPASSERYVVFLGFRGTLTDWNAPSWLNQILLGRATRQSPDAYTTLLSYLDEFDRDLLELNLKACFSILSCLDRKAAVLGSGGSYQSWYNEGPAVNVNMYKVAWRLE
eukprot:Nitzschia sp. Nitz4//scaffold58_size112336//18950//20302//NITZ4_004018-RA/size112336-processed-gene-0.60-mRNA-1//1//CDS//3329554944//5141//frame0